MILAITDCETSGLSPDTDRIIDVAVVLYSVDHACVIETWSSLVEQSDAGPTDIHGITTDQLKALGIPEGMAYPKWYGWAGEADAILAHNAPFDRAFLEMAHVAHCDLEPHSGWIDSLDIEWPRRSSSRSLVQLALAHGLGVSDAHRALSDCLLLARLLTRSAELGADLPAMVARAALPRYTYQALVSYDDRGLAKDAGFRWDSERRQWLRRLLPEDAAALPFRTQVTS